MSDSTQYNTNGAAGSAVASNSPTAGNGQQTALEYLRSYPHLPELIKAFLNIDEEVEDKNHPKLLNSPKVRDLDFTIQDSSDFKQFNTLRVVYQVRALFVYTTGQVTTVPDGAEFAANCRGKIFRGVVVPVPSINGGEDYKSPQGRDLICSLPSYAACANHQYNEEGSKCYLRKTKEARSAAAKKAANEAVTKRKREADEDSEVVVDNEGSEDEAYVDYEDAEDDDYEE